MKQAFLSLTIGLSAGLLLANPVAAPPTKLFDVRNGDGAVIGAETYPDALIIVFKTAAAKNTLAQDFADVYNYPATVPCTAPNTPVAGCTVGQPVANPQNKGGFFRDKLKDFLKRTHSEAAAITAMNAARVAADAETPQE